MDGVGAHHGHLCAPHLSDQFGGYIQSETSLLHYSLLSDFHDFGVVLRDHI